MDKNFTPEDHAYLRKSEVDSSGMERECQKVLIEYVTRRPETRERETWKRLDQLYKHTFTDKTG
jgi:hypothetical protein